MTSHMWHVACKLSRVAFSITKYIGDTSLAFSLMCVKLVCKIAAKPRASLYGSAFHLDSLNLSKGLTSSTTCNSKA